MSCPWLDKALRQVSSAAHRYISAGHCKLCKHCSCKNQLACKHPDKLTYSFEALGINVQEMVQELFGLPLLWYSKANLPQYTSVVAGMLSKQPFDPQVVIDILSKEAILN
jgi:predicted metal-binding protein